MTTESNKTFEITSTITITPKPKSIIVSFHVGRGGYHKNPGYKSFNPYAHSIQDFFDYGFLYYEDEDGNTLPDEEWTLTDQSGNIILEGRQEIESPVGVLEWDTIYDTDIVRYIEDCTDDEIEILYNELANYKYMDYDVADYVCRKKGMKRVVDQIGNISFSKSTMKVIHQDGIDTYERDTFKGMDEYEAREFLKEERFIPDSIREIVSYMQIEEWL